MDTMEERLSKWVKAKGMDMTDNYIVEDTTLNLEEVERVHKGVMMVKHQNENGTERNR
jgi:SOS-response transcriptional repressor LexA